MIELHQRSLRERLRDTFFLAETIPNPYIQTNAAIRQRDTMAVQIGQTLYPAVVTVGALMQDGKDPMRYASFKVDAYPKLFVSYRIFPDRVEMKMPSDKRLVPMPANDMYQDLFPRLEVASRFGSDAREQIYINNAVAELLADPTEIEITQKLRLESSQDFPNVIEATQESTNEENPVTNLSVAMRQGVIMLPSNDRLSQQPPNEASLIEPPVQQFILNTALGRLEQAIIACNVSEK